jgi:CheY-like chemotaxis protein
VIWNDSSDAPILLVEDDDLNQVVATTMLRSLGYLNVRTAANGRQALRACDEASFDLILMDCQMPEMDGFQATRALRARGTSTPIIAFTSESALVRSRCLKAGMNDFLAKPASLTDMGAVVRRWISRDPEASPDAAAPNWLWRLLQRMGRAPGNDAAQAHTAARSPGLALIDDGSGAAGTRRT